MFDSGAAASTSWVLAGALPRSPAAALHVIGLRIPVATASVPATIRTATVGVALARSSSPTRAPGEMNLRTRDDRCPAYAPSRTTASRSDMERPVKSPPTLQ